MLEVLRMNKPRLRTVLLAVLATGVTGVALVYVVYRPWALSWGAVNAQSRATSSASLIIVFIIVSVP